MQEEKLACKYCHKVFLYSFSQQHTFPSRITTPNNRQHKFFSRVPELCTSVLDSKGAVNHREKVLSVRRRSQIEYNSIGKLYFPHFLFQVFMFSHKIPTEISSKSCLFYDEFFSDRKNEKLLVAVWLWN